jgi:hypothetical protein
LPVLSVKGEIIPLRKTKRRSQINWISGNIAVFAKGIPFIEKYDRLRDSTKEGFSAF